MNNNEFINKYTDGHCLSYLEFQEKCKKFYKDIKSYKIS